MPAHFSVIMGYQRLPSVPLDEENLSISRSVAPSQSSFFSKLYALPFFVLLLDIIWTWYLLQAGVGEGNCTLSHHKLNWVWKQVSAPSPLMEQIPLGLVNHTIDGRLRDNTTIYRQEPSPEVDAAWDALSHEGDYLFNVTAEDLRRSGKDPSTCVPWEAGVDVYPASLEVFHLIHCLNMVRKDMFPEYYYRRTPDRDPSEDKVRRTHSMHCLYMVLQNLMCHSDVDIIPTVWTPAPYAPDRKGVPTGNFSLNKKCRDFETVSEWLTDHHVVHGNDKLAGLEMPEDAKIFDEDGYWR